LKDSELEAMTFNWQSPLHHDVAHGAGTFSGLLAVPVAEKAELMQVAARSCFWKPGQPQLRRIAKEIAIEIPSSASLVQLLTGLIKGCADMDDEELLRTLRMRLAPATSDLEAELLAASDDMMEYLDQSDQQELHGMKHIQEELASTMGEYEHDLKPLVLKVRVARVAAAAASRPGTKQSSGSAASSSAAPSNKRARRYPAFPEGEADLTSQRVEQYLPPGCKLQKDPHNCRWQVTRQGHPRISRSWNKWGIRGAAIKALQEVWQRHEDDWGEQCPFPGVTSYKKDV
jgi:hypothetical protein